MEDLIYSVYLMRENVPVVLLFMLALWGINAINWVLGGALNVLGIVPRNIFGILGIFFSPFLHGNFNHLFFNSIPLFVLANFVLLNGLVAFYAVTASIIVISGALVWIFARRAIHIGASSLIMGYWSYVLIGAYYQTTIVAVLLGFISLYYFGGLFMSLLPGEEKVSWEGHVFGFIGGIITQYLVSANILIPLAYKELAIMMPSWFAAL